MDGKGIFPALESKTSRSKPGRAFLRGLVDHTVSYCPVTFCKIESFFVTPLFSVTFDRLKPNRIDYKEPSLPFRRKFSRRIT